MHLSRLWTDTQVRSKKLKKLSSMPNQAKQKQAKFSEVATLRETEDAETQETRISTLSNLTKNQGFHSRQGESSTVPLNTPVQGEPLTTRSATPCSWHSPPLLVSVATNCLNREGLELKLRCHYSHYTLHAGPLLLVFSTVKGV